LVHLGLVVWLCHLGPAPSANTFVIFGVAVFWLYLIAFISAGGQLQRLHPLARQLMFFVGLNYIAFAFAVDFLQIRCKAGPNVYLSIFHSPRFRSQHQACVWLLLQRASLNRGRLKSLSSDPVHSELGSELGRGPCSRSLFPCALFRFAGVLLLEGENLARTQGC
jgi:hypothetical protein